MYKMLKQIHAIGIKTEAPPLPDEALRVTAQRLEKAIIHEITRLARTGFLLNYRRGVVRRQGVGTLTAACEAGSFSMAAAKTKAAR